MSWSLAELAAASWRRCEVQCVGELQGSGAMDVPHHMVACRQRRSSMAYLAQYCLLQPH